ncbi:THAP domain-containing protein 9, partial [Trachymyrmex cornetzi]
LPHLSTVRKWHAGIDIKSGICEAALEILTEKHVKANNTGKKLLCSMMVDDIAIRKHVRWNGKKFTGFVTYNKSNMKNVKTNRQRSKLSNRAVEAMVIMVVCLNENWKIPVAYHFINGLNGEDRANIILECLEKLHPTGINVISLTFDGGTSNIKMAESLGAKFCYTTNFDLSIRHPVTKEPIFLIFDACHAIKLVRNTFGDKKELIDGDGNMIQWNIIFFSSVRSRGGNNNNPTTEQFQSALKWLLIYAQVGSSDYANCIKKDETYTNTLTNARNEHSSSNNFTSDISFEEQQNTNDIIAGFVIKNIAKSIKCACKKLLTNYKSLSSLQEIKNRGKLTSASADVIEICLIAERTFREIEIYETENVKNVLIEKTMERIPLYILDNKENCTGNHRKFITKKILNMFFDVRLHYESTCNFPEEVRIRSKNTKLILFKSQ